MGEARGELELVRFLGFEWRGPFHPAVTSGQQPT